MALSDVDIRRYTALWKIKVSPELPAGEPFILQPLACRLAAEFKG